MAKSYTFKELHDVVGDWLQLELKRWVRRNGGTVRIFSDGFTVTNFYYYEKLTKVKLPYDKMCIFVEGTDDQFRDCELTEVPEIPRDQYQCHVSIGTAIVSEAGPFSYRNHYFKPYITVTFASADLVDGTSEMHFRLYDELNDIEKSYPMSFDKSKLDQRINRDVIKDKFTRDLIKECIEQLKVDVERRKSMLLYEEAEDDVSEVS